MFARWRIGLARRLVRGLGIGLFWSEDIDAAQRVCDHLIDYSLDSGHLTRAYHAGRRVQSYAAVVRNRLRVAGTLSW